MLGDVEQKESCINSINQQMLQCVNSNANLSSVCLNPSESSRIVTQYIEMLEHYFSESDYLQKLEKAANRDVPDSTCKNH
jgi:hypothetical protein